LAPWGQLHITDLLAILLATEVNKVQISEELRTVEELGDQLSDILLII
jgi:hypothetical protein